MKKFMFLFLLMVWLVACEPIPSTPTSTGENPRDTTQTTSHPTSVQTAQPLTKSATSPAESDNPNLKLKQVSKIQANINGIVVSSDLAYVGLGQSVAVIDISQHENPRLIGQSDPLPGAVSLLLQIQTELEPNLLVSAGKNLIMLDSFTSDTFIPVQQMDLSGTITAMIFDPDSNILYAGGKINKNSGFISVVKITPVGEMRAIRTISMPEFPLSLGLAPESLFVGAEGYQGGLYHIALTSPGELSQAKLVIESTPTNPLQPFSLQVIGERLYLSYKAIEAYDISDPEKPQQLWRGAGHVVREFRVDGDQIYWFGWTIKSEMLYEVITPPEMISGSPMGLIAGCTAIHEGDFLIAYEGLEIYEMVER